MQKMTLRQLNWNVVTIDDNVEIIFKRKLSKNDGIHKLKNIFNADFSE